MINACHRAKSQRYKRPRAEPFIPQKGPVGGRRHGSRQKPYGTVFGLLYGEILREMCYFVRKLANARIRVKMCELPREKPENLLAPGETHTVEVTGSSPVTPTKFKSCRNQELRYLPMVGSAAFP
jgi:hypothetical protein